MQQSSKTNVFELCLLIKVDSESLQKLVKLQKSQTKSNN